jgi:uncharacterized delta-60 repeat protein
MSLRPSALPLVCAAMATAVLGSATPARGASPGSLDPSFGSGGIAATGSDSRLFGTVVQGDGKVVGVGEGGAQSNVASLVLARYTSSGSFDRSFGSGGVARSPPIPTAQDTNSLGRAVAIQSNGKLVVVGSATDPTGAYADGLIVERYNSNGSLDASFGSGGVVTALTGQSFGDGYAVAIQPDGKIVAAGSATAAGSGGVAPRAAVLRLNADGSLDTSFGAGGIDVLDFGAYSYARAVALQPGGQIVIAGSRGPGAQSATALIARLTASGALDRSFAGTGFYAYQNAQGASSSAFNAVLVQGDGKIVAAGDAASGNAGADTLLVRFTPGGAQDGAFGSNGVMYTQSAVNWSFGATPAVPGANGEVLAPNGDIVVAGSYANSATTYATLWAITPSGSLDRAFGVSGASVLTNSDAVNTEYGAIVLSPTNDEFVVAGDAVPSSGLYTGIAGRYAGLGVPSVPLELSVKGVRRSYKMAAVVKHGLKLSVGVNEPATIKVSLGISASVAHALHLTSRRHGTVQIASSRATLASLGTKSIILRLSELTGRALAKRKRVSLELVVTATASDTHKTQTNKRGVSLWR